MSCVARAILKRKRRPWVLLLIGLTFACGALERQPGRPTKAADPDPTSQLLELTRLARDHQGWKLGGTSHRLVPRHSGEQDDTCVGNNGDREATACALALECCLFGEVTRAGEFFAYRCMPAGTCPTGNARVKVAWLGEPTPPSSQEIRAARGLEPATPRGTTDDHQPSAPAPAAERGARSGTAGDTGWKPLTTKVVVRRFGATKAHRLVVVFGGLGSTPEQSRRWAEALTASSALARRVHTAYAVTGPADQYYAGRDLDASIAQIARDLGQAVSATPDRPFELLIIAHSSGTRPGYVLVDQVRAADSTSGLPIVYYNLDGFSAPPTSRAKMTHYHVVAGRAGAVFSTNYDTLRKPDRPSPGVVDLSASGCDTARCVHMALVDGGSASVPTSYLTETL
jgi:hypothetical protein